MDFIKNFEKVCSMINFWFFILDVLRFMPLAFVMAYAAYSDFKTGEVGNKIFLYGVVGAGLTVLQAFLFGSWGLLFVDLFVAGLTWAVALGAFFLGGCGGADAKMLMVLGVSAPLLPLWSGGWCPLPFVVLPVAGVGALVYVVVKRKDGVAFSRREVRFLPFMFVGFVVAMLL